MPACCVVGCASRQNFHRFPRNPNVARRWIAAIKKTPGQRSGWTPNASSRVCERHFADSDFERREGTPFQRRLNRKAVPSVFPGMTKFRQGVGVDYNPGNLNKPGPKRSKRPPALSHDQVREEHSYFSGSPYIKNKSNDDWCWNTCFYKDLDGKKIYMNYKEKAAASDKFVKDPNPKILTSEGFNRLKKVVEDVPQTALRPPKVLPSLTFEDSLLTPEVKVKVEMPEPVPFEEQKSAVPNKAPLMPKQPEAQPSMPVKMERMPTLTVDGSKSNTIVVMPANSKGRVSTGRDPLKDFQIQELKRKLFQFMKANEKYAETVAGLKSELKVEKSKREKLTELVPPLWSECVGQDEYVPKEKSDKKKSKGLKWKPEIVQMASDLRNKVGLKYYMELYDKGLPLPSARRLKARTRKEEIRMETIKRNFEEIDREDPNKKKILIRGPASKKRLQVVEESGELEEVPTQREGNVKQEPIEFVEHVIEQPPDQSQMVEVSSTLLDESLLTRDDQIQEPPQTSFRISGIPSRPEMTFKVEAPNWRNQKILRSKIPPDMPTSVQFFMPN